MVGCWALSTRVLFFSLSTAPRSFLNGLKDWKRVWIPCYGDSVSRRTVSGLSLTGDSATWPCGTRCPHQEQHSAGSVPWRLTLLLLNFQSLVPGKWEREQYSAEREQREGQGVLEKLGGGNPSLPELGVFMLICKRGTCWALYSVLAKSVTLNPSSTTCWLGDAGQVT